MKEGYEGLSWEHVGVDPADSDAISRELFMGRIKAARFDLREEKVGWLGYLIIAGGTAITLGALVILKRASKISNTLSWLESLREIASRF